MTQKRFPSRKVLIRFKLFSFGSYRMKLLRIGKSQPRHRDVEPQMGTTRRILQGSSQIEQQKSTAKEIGATGSIQAGDSLIITF